MSEQLKPVTRDQRFYDAIHTELWKIGELLTVVIGLLEKQRPTDKATPKPRKTATKKEG